MKKGFVLMMLAFSGMFMAAKAGDIRFELAPNPASSQVKILFSQTAAGYAKVEVFSLLGTHINTPEPTLSGNRELTLNVASLPDGIYLVRVSDGNGSSVHRLKVQHN